MCPVSGRFEPDLRLCDLKSDTHTILWWSSPENSEENTRRRSGTDVAPHVSTMRKFAAVLIVACVVVGTAFVSTAPQRRWREKVDPALVQTAKDGGSEPVRALIRLRPGTTDEFVAHLSKSHGIQPAAVSGDVVSVQMPASMLRGVALDRDVVQVSLP
jgi:hypothetical protein